MPGFAQNPYFLIFSSGILWGSTFTLTLIATADGTHPVVLAALQVVVCSLVFGLICKGGGILLFHRHHIKYYCVLAFIGISFPNILYYNAAPHLSAGILSVTVSTVPMLTYALMWVLRLEPFRFRRLTGILLGMAAILMLVLPDHGLQSGDASFWTLAVLLCATCYAVENVYISEGIDDSADVRQLLFGSNVIAMIVLLPLSFQYADNITPAWFVSASAWAILGVSLTSILAYMMFFYAIKTAGPVFASQCAYIVTTSGVIWGIITLGEKHSTWIWGSVAVMLVGLFLVTPRRRKAKQPIAVGAN